MLAGFYSGNSRNIQNTSWRLVKKIYDTYIYDVLFQFSRRMAYAGLVKRAKSHLENCNNGPEETPVQAIAATFWAREPAGPECNNLGTISWDTFPAKCGLDAD